MGSGVTQRGKSTPERPNHYKLINGSFSYLLQLSPKSNQPVSTEEIFLKEAAVA